MTDVLKTFNYMVEDYEAGIDQCAQKGRLYHQWQEGSKIIITSSLASAQLETHFASHTVRTSYQELSLL